MLTHSKGKASQAFPLAGRRVKALHTPKYDFIILPSHRHYDLSCAFHKDKGVKQPQINTNRVNNTAAALDNTSIHEIVREGVFVIPMALRGRVLGL